MIIEAEFDEVDEVSDVASEETELDLTEDDSLPWLEAEDEDEGRSGVDIAQIIGFALILGVLAFVLISAIWYFSNRTGDDAPIADGSTIEAPEGPIKEAPEDPGGKEFAGTGNVAPVVGEGGTREGVLNTDGNAGAQAGSGESADGAAGASAGAGAGTSADGNGASGSASGASAGSSSGVGVQLAAYSSRARAEQGWNDLSRRTDALNGARYRIEEGQVDIGTVYRLQAVVSDRAAGDRLCAALKSDGLDCQVKP